MALYAASLVGSLAALAAVPAYLYFLGIEAYALTGVLATMQMWFTLLDLGLSPALSRSVTQFAAGTRDAAWLGSVFRGLEYIFLGVAGLFAGIIMLAAPWLSGVWLDAATLPPETVIGSLTLIGGICGLRLWQGLYVGGITGLQQLQWLSAFNAIAACARVGLPVAAIAWWWTDVRMLMAATLVVGAVEVAVVRWRFRSRLPPESLRQPVRWHCLLDVRSYAGGLALTSLVTILLTGLDKVILPVFVSLEAFGWYMLAFTCSQALYRLVAPVQTAVLPRLTELLERGDTAGFGALYHRAAQVVAVMVMPVGLIIAACPEFVLRVWIGDVAAVPRAAEVLRVLAIATVLHSCMYVPYAAQLAHGWTGLALRINLVMAVLLVPALIIGVQYHGIMAAAWTWLVLNVVYLLVGQALMTRRILRGHLLRWYLADLAPVMVTAAACAVVTAGFISPDYDRLTTAAMLISATLGATLLAALVSPLRAVLPTMRRS